MDSLDSPSLPRHSSGGIAGNWLPAFLTDNEAAVVSQKFHLFVATFCHVACGKTRLLYCEIVEQIMAVAEQATAVSQVQNCWTTVAPLC